MAGEPSDDEILSAIEKSGYLLEQEVASELETFDYHVETNVPFLDKDEGKSREIDVTAFRRIFQDETKQITASIELIIECKNSANPLVFIGRRKNGADPLRAPRGYVFPRSYQMQKPVGTALATRSVSGFFHLGFAERHYAYRDGLKVVQFCRIDRSGGSWSANHGGLYDSVFFPLAKAVDARIEAVPKSLENGWKHLSIIIPVVVTTSRLFLIDGTRTGGSLVPRDYVSFSRELRSSNINGRYRVDFVNRSSLSAFITNCILPLEQNALALASSNLPLLLNPTVEWSD